MVPTMWLLTKKSKIPLPSTFFNQMKSLQNLTQHFGFKPRFLLLHQYFLPNIYGFEQDFYYCTNQRSLASKMFLNSSRFEKAFKYLISFMKRKTRKRKIKSLKKITIDNSNVHFPPHVQLT